MNTLLSVLLSVVLLQDAFLVFSVAEQTCSVTGNEGRDPNLKEMTFDLGNGMESFWAYVTPNVTSFYLDKPPSSRPVAPKHEGLAGLFINMSNKNMRLYWIPSEDEEEQAKFMEMMPPFSNGGTATFPGHIFFMSSDDDPKTPLIYFHVEGFPNNRFTYDPYHVEGDEIQTEKNLRILSHDDRQIYDSMRRTQLFNEEYKKFTGRSYLTNYPRAPPMHYMWRADHFGQTHWVVTKETHFTTIPPDVELNKVEGIGAQRILGPDSPRMLHDYRQEGTLNMTMKVLSCAPRVFEIPNFLSQVEVDHILKIASEENLALSSTGLGNSADELDKTMTRTSYNSWVERERSPIVDAVYRRAADLMRIDESLLRYRGEGEQEEILDPSSLAETLQLVHYDPGQEYTAHHDFGFSNADDPIQGQRFATLLLYLNEGMIGGSTSFPRWLNAETFEELHTVPAVGKAVLFYSQLPDGNMDDLSQHQANKVREGEKWLINLWVWDPLYV